jgi:hypothetical protein
MLRLFYKLYASVFTNILQCGECPCLPKGKVSEVRVWFVTRNNVKFAGIVAGHRSARSLQSELHFIF